MSSKKLMLGFVLAERNLRLIASGGVIAQF
jgi:hypothetical protein